jgi:catechol-2,3-dioxygenase
LTQKIIPTPRSSLNFAHQKKRIKKSTTYGLTHLAIAVKNVERTLHFYQQIFGMEVMYHFDKMIQLTTPGSHDILVLKKGTRLW